MFAEKPHSSALGKAENLVTFTPVDGMLRVFPKMCDYSSFRTPPFCGLEGALQINFVPQPVSRDSIAIFVWNISSEREEPFFN